MPRGGCLRPEPSWNRSCARSIPVRFRSQTPSSWH
eukprot:gene26658-biopygen17089